MADYEFYEHSGSLGRDPLPVDENSKLFLSPCRRRCDDTTYSSVLRSVDFIKSPMVNQIQHIGASHLCAIIVAVVACAPKKLSCSSTQSSVWYKGTVNTVRCLLGPGILDGGVEVELVVTVDWACDIARGTSEERGGRT